MIYTIYRDIKKNYGRKHDVPLDTSEQAVAGVAKRFSSVASTITSLPCVTTLKEGVGLVMVVGMFIFSG